MRDLNTILKCCGDALARSADVEVPLGWRVRLWHTMNRVFAGESLFRRGVLAYVIAKRTLPLWEAMGERIEPRLRALPQQLVRDCRQLVAKKITRKDAKTRDVCIFIELRNSTARSAAHIRRALT